MRNHWQGAVSVCGLVRCWRLKPVLGMPGGGSWNSDSQGRCRTSPRLLCKAFAVSQRPSCRWGIAERDEAAMLSEIY